MSLGFPGLWDGMNSGIGALYSGAHLGCPLFLDFGTVFGLVVSTVGHSGHVGVPGTLE